MMRLITALFMVLAIVSCDWVPEEVGITDRVSYLAINLAVGDTSTIEIMGQDFVLENTVDAQVVELIQSEGGGGVTFTLVALTAGQTQLQLSYTEYGPDGQEFTKLHTLHILVSDGILLDVASRSETLIYYSDYLTENELDQLDSVGVTLESESGDQIIFPDGGHDLNYLSFIGNHPGEATIQVNFFDEARGLITGLLFQCHVSIPKVIMAELFTNSGCVNCPEANHYIDNIYAGHSEDMALVRYHVSWTDPHDPMNNYNPTEVRERVIFYGIFLAPSFVLDGSIVSTLDETDWIARIDAASQMEAPVYISPIQVSESADSLMISYDLESFQEDLGELDVWSMVLEDSVYYEGSNGEEIHNQVMRDMTSTRVSGILADQEVIQSLKQPAAENVGTSRSLLVYVQRTDTKQVIQAAKRVLN